MKSIITIFIIAFFPVAVSAQADYYDSLKRELQKATNDTLKMDIYRNLGFYLQNGKVDSAYYFHQQQLKYAKKLNMKLYEADANQQIAYTCVWNNELPEALKHYNEALKVASDPHAADIEWGFHNFSFSESPEEARWSIVGMIHFELSNLYTFSRLPDKSLYHLKKGLEIGEKLNNHKILSLTNRDLAYEFNMADQPDSVLFYLQKSLSHYQNSRYLIGLGNVYEGIGYYFLTRQQYDSAFAYLRKGISTFINNNDLLSLSNVYNRLGRIYLNTNQPDSAQWYAMKGIEVAENIKSDFSASIGYQLLSEIYENANEPTLALEALQKAKLKGDSINEDYINKLIQFQNDGFENEMKLKKIEEEQAQFQNQLKMIALISIIVVFLIIAIFLYRNNHLRRKANLLLKKQKKELQATLEQLKSTQSQLIHSEKMASLGELTAGIAHEIQNPLNFVNNFSDLNKELIQELQEAISQNDLEETRLILADLADNEEKVTFHGKRAEEIVKSMLQHSRGSEGKKETTDINHLADEYLRLSYHGLRAKDKSFNANFKLETDPEVPKIDVIPQDIGRVLLNLINNAFQAVKEVDNPEVIVSIHASSDKVEIAVRDNGPGIPEAIKDKIFQPFFTTKPTGQGTGLGLSMSYDIVTKGHDGNLLVQSEVGKGAKFIITLPIN